MLRPVNPLKGSESGLNHIVLPPEIPRIFIDERVRVMDGKGHRWLDLTRTGTLIPRVRQHNLEGGPNIQDFHIFRPIPLEQIDRTVGGYPQNCGYIGADC